MAGLGSSPPLLSRHHSVSSASEPDVCGAAMLVPLQNEYRLLVPLIGVPQEPPSSLRVEPTRSPGAVMVGTKRPSTAGPRELKPEISLRSPLTRQVSELAVTTTFLASFGEVSVVEPGPELPAENTIMNGSATLVVSKLPSSTMMSWVRSVAW